jgi:hypothetical protein
MNNKWLSEAEAAVKDYKAKRKRGDYPAFPQTGLCQRAARCLYEAVTGRKQPWARGSATDSRIAAVRQKRAIEARDGANAYHRAIGLGKLVPGACLYLGGNGAYGHVCVVVEICGDPAQGTKGVRVFENTSGKRMGDGPGTILTTLNRVLGSQGTGRILAVVPPEGD